MQQRYYDPRIGRFWSVDPVTAFSSPGSNFNRYAYANNNPYKFTDPDGRNATAALGGLVVESINFLQGESFNGAQVLGALKDGYNGEGAGFGGALMQDVGTASVGAGGTGAVKGLRILVARKAASTVAKSATQIAREGGRHAGQLKQFLKQTPKQLQRTIKSFEKGITKHEGWIENPTSKVKNFGRLRPEHQENLIHHWRQDVARHKELKSIAQDVLRGR